MVIKVAKQIFVFSVKLQDQNVFEFIGNLETERYLLLWKIKKLQEIKNKCGNVDSCRNMVLLFYVLCIV